jgi:hypothetical protein
VVNFASDASADELASASGASADELASASSDVSGAAVPASDKDNVSFLKKFIKVKPFEQHNVFDHDQIFPL